MTNGLLVVNLIVIRTKGRSSDRGHMKPFPRRLSQIFSINPPLAESIFRTRSLSGNARRHRLHGIDILSDSIFSRGEVTATGWGTRTDSETLRLCYHPGRTWNEDNGFIRTQSFLSDGDTDVLFETLISLLDRSHTVNRVILTGRK